MIMSRRGVIGLPVRLTISLMIIALMVPPISALADSIQDGVDEREVYEAADYLKGTIVSVYSKGPSYMTHIELNVPDDCYLAVGGYHSTYIVLYSGGEAIGRILMDAPVEGDERFISGDALLEVSNVIDGVQKVSVREI